MTEATLFDLPEPQEQAPTPPTRPEEAWVLRPDRQQLQWLPRDLEAARPKTTQPGLSGVFCRTRTWLPSIAPSGRW